MIGISRVRQLACLLVAAVTCAAGCTAVVDKSGGRLSTPPLVLHGIDTRASQEIRPFVDEVTKLSNGHVEMMFDADWRKTDANADAEAIAAVRAGSEDFAAVPVRAWHAAGVRSFDALIAPMLIDSYALQVEVLQDPMVGDMLSGVAKLGLTGIAVLPGPMRKPAGITRDLLAPGDLQGKRIAFSDGVVADRSLRQLGATPLPSAFNGADMTSFDGVEQQVSSIDGNRYDGVIRSVTANVSLWPRPFVIVGSAAAVKRLSAQQLGFLMEAAGKSVPEVADEQQDLDGQSVPVLCQRAKLTFLASNSAQLQEWRDAFRPVYDWLAQDAQSRGFLQHIQQLRGNPALRPDQAPRCLAATSTVVPTTAGAVSLDGRWTVTYTRAEFTAAGPDPGEADVPDNWGTFWVDFHAGSFSSGSNAGLAISGDYVVQGDLMTLNIRSTGEMFQFHCSVYRNTLTFAKVAGSASPTGYTVKPWIRG